MTTFFAVNPEACSATVEGKVWKLAFDMAAIAQFERVTDKSFFDAVDHVTAVTVGLENPRFTLLGHLVVAGMRREHGVVDHDTAMRIAVPLLPAINAALIEAVPALKKDADDAGDGEGEGGDKGENPTPLASDANDGTSTN